MHSFIIGTPISSLEKKEADRGVLELEEDVPKGTRLWLTGWCRRDGIGNEFLSLIAEPAIKGGRPRR